MANPANVKHLAAHLGEKDLLPESRPLQLLQEFVPKDCMMLTADLNHVEMSCPKRGHVFATIMEPPGGQDVVLLNIEAQPRGVGLGTQFAKALKGYVDARKKGLRLESVYNDEFAHSLGFLEPRPNGRWAYHSSAPDDEEKFFQELMENADRRAKLGLHRAAENEIEMQDFVRHTREKLRGA